MSWFGSVSARAVACVGGYDLKRGYALTNTTPSFIAELEHPKLTESPTPPLHSPLSYLQIRLLVHACTNRLSFDSCFLKSWCVVCSDRRFMNHQSWFVLGACITSPFVTCEELSSSFIEYTKEVCLLRRALLVAWLPLCCSVHLLSSKKPHAHSC